MTVADEALLSAWARWDASPAWPAAADDMEDACQALAAEVGVTATVLRDRLMDACGRQLAVGPLIDRRRALQEAIGA